MPAGPGVYREGSTLRVRRAAPEAPAPEPRPSFPAPGSRQAARKTTFIRVSLSLYAGLDRYAPGPTPGPLTVEVEDGLTVGELLEAFGLPPGEAKLVIVNHRAAEAGQVLRSGDQIGVFPLIAGG